MLAELDDEWGAWKYAFEYVEQDGAREVQPNGITSGPNKNLAFSRENVVHVVAMEEGDNEGPTWIGVFKLDNGRYAFIEGGCDYTGWDCQSYAEATVADTLDDLVRWALSDDDRQRLGDVLFPVAPEEMAAASAGLRALERSLSDDLD